MGLSADFRADDSLVVKVIGTGSATDQAARAARAALVVRRSGGRRRMWRWRRGAARWRGPSPWARSWTTRSGILVTMDGVRWQEIFTGADPGLADGAALPGGEARTARGLTPNLHHLFFDGGVVLGDPRLQRALPASGPNYVSLPAYVEMMTGAISGCADNGCEPRLPWGSPERSRSGPRPATSPPRSSRPGSASPAPSRATPEAS